ANGGHPRGYGAFTRVLGHYIREQQIMGLPTAINKMTALGAAHVGIKERGIIAPGYFADLVLLDPELVKDNADIENSKALSDGILMVWVNGEIVYQDKSATNRFPGVFLSK
ncbi:MAG: amidohydrolase family protein, partial [Chitinophagales bacterium]